MNELVKFWKSFDIDNPPFIHPIDRPHFRPADFEAIVDHKSFIASEQYGRVASTRIHDHLLPAPYAGDLSKADIFILMLNPGFSTSDYSGEALPAFRNLLGKTLRQELDDTDFPFMWLDPDICLHPGFAWWEKKLVNLIHGLRRGDSYLESSRRLSRRLACVELMPYHSKNFGLQHKLPSSNVAREFVRQIGARAAKGEAFVLATRRAKAWNLPDCDCVYLFTGGQARGAHITPNSEGGAKLMRFIEKKPTSCA